MCAFFSLHPRSTLDSYPTEFHPTLMKTSEICCVRDEKKKVNEQTHQTFECLPELNRSELEMSTASKTFFSRTFLYRIYISEMSWNSVWNEIHKKKGGRYKERRDPPHTFPPSSGFHPKKCSNSLRDSRLEKKISSSLLRNVFSQNRRDTREGRARASSEAAKKYEKKGIGESFNGFSWVSVAQLSQWQKVRDKNELYGAKIYVEEVKNNKIQKKTSSLHKKQRRYKAKRKRQRWIEKSINSTSEKKNFYL